MQHFALDGIVVFGFLEEAVEGKVGDIIH